MRLLRLLFLAFVLLAVASLAPAAQAAARVDETAQEAGSEAWSDFWDLLQETYGRAPHPGPTESYPPPQCPEIRIFTGVPGQPGMAIECNEEELPGWSAPDEPEEEAANATDGGPEAGEDGPAPAEASAEPFEEPAPEAPVAHFDLPSAEPGRRPPARDPEPALPARDAPSRPGRDLPGFQEAVAAMPPVLLLAAAAAAVLVPSTLLLKLASMLALRSRRKASGVPDTLLALLRREPGLHHMELVRRLGKGNGTVEHHLLRMVRAGTVRRVQTPGYTCYFASGPADAPDPQAALRVALRAPTARRLAAAVARAPPSSLSQLAQALGIAVSTAHYHAGRLVAAGLLRGGRDGGRRTFTLTDGGRACLDLPPAAPPQAPPPAQALAPAVGGSAGSIGYAP